MIEKTIHICTMNRLIDLAREEEQLASLIHPYISEHKRDYDVILDFGGFATISFEHEAMVLRSDYNFYAGTREFKFWGIKRFTRQRLTYFAETFARIISENLHEPGDPKWNNPDYEM